LRLHHSLLRCNTAISLSVQIGNIATVAFSSDRNEILSGYDNESIVKYNVYQRLEEPRYSVVRETATHMVYCAEGQYLAVVTPENEIHIWRAQYKGRFEQFVQLAGYTQARITFMQFNIIKTYSSREKRVILLVVYNHGQGYQLHTYDILTQREIREPVMVIDSHIHISDLLVDISSCMRRVVSAIHGASTVHIWNALNVVSAVTRQIYKILNELTSTSAYQDAVELFKQHPAIAFQPSNKKGASQLYRLTPIQYALTRRSSSYGEELLQLLDPDKPVLDGKHLNISDPSCCAAA
jgi:hypothetical protein